MSRQASKRRRWVTIADLIKALEQHDPTAVVYCGDGEFEVVTISGVVEAVAPAPNFFTGAPRPPGVVIR
jgi:hypothetical protein